MSTTNSVKEAISHFLVSQGLPECRIKLHENASPVTVVFDVNLVTAAQLLCGQQRFDLARDLRSKVSSARFFIDPAGGSCFDEVCDAPDATDDLHPDLVPTLATLYLNQFRDPLKRAAQVLDSAEEALVGPPDDVIKEIVTPGGFTMTLSAKNDPCTYVEDYFDSGDAEIDWEDMVFCFDNPFHVCNLSLTISSPDGELIGQSHLGRCSADRSSEEHFRREITQTYGSDLLRDAMHAARSIYPRKPRDDLKIAAKEPHAN